MRLIPLDHPDTLRYTLALAICETSRVTVLQHHTSGAITVHNHMPSNLTRFAMRLSSLVDAAPDASYVLAIRGAVRDGITSITFYQL